MSLAFLRILVMIVGGTKLIMESEVNMGSGEIKEKIVSIFESNERYGGAVKLVSHEPSRPPAFGIVMVFAFAETTDNHFLSLKRIIGELSKVGALNSFEYRGLKAPTENNQPAPLLHFNITIANSNYEIIFVLP